MKSYVGEFIGVPIGGRGPYLAGLALNAAIDDANTRSWWFLFTVANITLVNGTRQYTIPSGFSAHVASTVLNAGSTEQESPVWYLPPDQFFRAGYDTTAQGGTPLTLTVYEETATTPTADDEKVFLDRNPGAALGGRTLRIAYFRKIPSLSADADTLKIDLSAENWLLEDAIWRVRRMRNDPQWVKDKQMADDAKMRLLAKVRSVDVYALGGV